MAPGRAVSRAALAAAIGIVATGCVTVDGATARVPGLDEHEAARVLAQFDTQNNEVYAKRDSALNKTIESGSFGAIDQGALQILRFGDPKNTRPSAPVTHDNAQFWIPRTAGWPKWFAVRNSPSYAKDRTMLLVFVKSGPNAPWMASWGPSARPGEALPEPKRDAQGYVEQVSLDEAGLAVAPGKAPETLTGYLTDGKSTLFAPGPQTSEARKTRETPVQDGFVRQFADQTRPQYTPLAMRTNDGGALVFFALMHTSKLTLQPPKTFGDLDPSQAAFLTRKPTKSVTENRLAEYAVLVPRAGAGQIRVVATASGVVSADGE